ncbi:MAG: thioredoxin family protein [candidate division WS1 bacterium]|nr:thioredoxin family protein [candidate division WS1 bacterium]
MKVQILGTGCPKCKKLAANAEEAIAASGVDAEIVKIDKLGEIMEFGVMMTPALAIDGEVKASGKVLSAAEITEMLKGA